MIKSGIDRIEAFPELFQGRRLGMVTSVSAVTRDLRPSYLAFHEKFPLQCLFSPEHGLHARYGNGENVREEPVEPETGASLVSLFGDWTAKHIPDDWMDRLDAVVYDIQDLGTRFYTYITTMIQAMEDCVAAGKDFIILDRPALLGGDVVEGCLLDSELHSFIGPYSLPIRSVRTGVALLYKITELRPGSVKYHPSRYSARPHISFLSGCTAWEGELPPLERLLESWERDCVAFQKRKKKYHIYP